MKVFSFTDWLASGGSNTLSGYVASLGAYSGNNWVYAAINRIALTASSAPLLFFEGKPNELPTFEPKQLITDKNHPALKLFNPPKYPLIPSLRELLYRTFLHLSIDGKLFWIIERKGKLPVNIDLRGKDELIPVFKDLATQRDVVGWVETSINKTYRLQDVLLIQEYKPDLTSGASLEGLSPLRPARASLESDFQINGWNSSFFKTGMKTPLLLQAKGKLTQDQKDEIRKEVINYYSGIDGGHGALILQGGITVTPLTVGTKDIDFIQGKKLTREEILAVFGVPPSMVGLFEYASYANAREQTQTFWEQTLLPRLSALLDLIQINILDIDFPGVYAKWDTAKVAGLKPDPIALATPAKTYLDMGYHPTQIARILDFPVLVPDKTFDKLKIERQNQQLAYQQQLQELSNTNQNNNQTSTDQQSNQDKPKKALIERLIATKLSLYVQERDLYDASYRLELWDLIVADYIRGLALAQCGYGFMEKLMPLVQPFSNADSKILTDRANDIAKILVLGIYNTPERN